MLEVTMVTNDDDWDGLYFGDELVTEGHSIHTYELLKLLEDKGLLKFEVIIADEMLEEMGRCPSNLKDVIPDEED